MRSSAPLGVRLRPNRVTRFAAGITIRSLKASSVGTAPPAAYTRSMACKPLFTLARPRPVDVSKMNITTRPRKTSPTAAIRNSGPNVPGSTGPNMSMSASPAISTSDLHLDHADHPEHAADHQYRADQKHHDAERVGIQ